MQLNDVQKIDMKEEIKNDEDCDTGRESIIRGGIQHKIKSGWRPLNESL